MDEFELIKAAKSGELDAFNRLILAYQDIAYNVAYRMLGDADNAADATQIAFINAFRHVKSFRGGSFRAWILRIVTNACYDSLRQYKRKPTTTLEPVDQDDETLESPRWMVDPGESPEETLLRSELARAIQHCLDRLTPDFRAVVVMIDIQGFDYAEAASVLKKPLGTIKSRLARARSRMQQCLQAFRELLPSAFRLGEESVL